MKVIIDTTKATPEQSAKWKKASTKALREKALAERILAHLKTPDEVKAKRKEARK